METSGGKDKIKFSGIVSKSSEHFMVFGSEKDDGGSDGGSFCDLSSSGDFGGSGENSLLEPFDDTGGLSWAVIIHSILILHELKGGESLNFEFLSQIFVLSGVDFG